MHVYKITNLLNGKIYIGKTIEDDLKKRMIKHVSLSKKEHPSMNVCKAIKKYGEENFKIESLYKGKNNEEICLKEKEFIKLYNSQDKTKGYNILDGGDGVVPTEELRLMLSERGKKLTGSKNPFYGKTHSDEFKKALSKRNKGNKIWLGRKHSEETKKKLSEIMKNRPIEILRKISETQKKRIGEKASRNRAILCIELDKEFYSIKKASEYLSVLFGEKFSTKNIGEVCRGNKYSCNGLTFKFKDGVIKKQRKTNTKSKITIIEEGKVFNTKKECCDFLLQKTGQRFHEKYIKNNTVYKKYTFTIS